ncbi:MAG: hypothetical protein IJ086_05695 [Clostridium sp.]|nr:hypothetical protein [Clostridium sp.]
MKKENIVIEIGENIIQEISKLNYEYSLDLNYLSFNDFVIHKDFKVDSSTIESITRVSHQYRNLVPHLSNKEIDALIKTITKDMSSGINTHVKRVDKTLEIRSDSIDFDLTFNDYIVPAEWMLSENYSLELVNASEKVSSLVKENVDYQKSILLTALEVVGLLIYLQLPNEVKNIQKSSKLEVSSKSNKKKSNSKKKIYLYKTTYRIIDVDLEKYCSNTRNYNRKIDEWAARGHWRTLKDGRKIWIKECIKRSKTPVNNPNGNTSYNYKITKADI